jgi:Fe/S biogenesis protein NfuA
MDVTTTVDHPTDNSILSVSDVALQKILDLRSDEADGEELGLRIEITGNQGVDFTYDLAFEVLSDIGRDGDVVIDTGGGLQVVVSADDVEHLRGAELDLPSEAEQSGLVLRNPNRPDLGGPAGEVQLSGTTEEKVRQLLEQQINPAIAAHGGFAELVAVEGEVARVRLGGGCQGCAMSRMTVTAGIESAIREHIPEVTTVEDVTDHASGENPFFADG